MPRKKRLGLENDSHERWLLTYADLITLLLAFFIVMYSMSRIDAGRFNNVAEALQGVLKGRTVIMRGKTLLNGEDVGGGALKIGDLRLMHAKIIQAIREAGIDQEINPIIDERGLVIHVTESALFDEGSADLEPRARRALDIVARSLKGLANGIRIEGHTDSRPIHTQRFPSNWELSTARAATVVRYFVDDHQWSPDHISALGYGEFRPLAPNDNAENMAKNRRVDIVVLAENLAASEPTSYPYSYSDTTSTGVSRRLNGTRP